MTEPIQVLIIGGGIVGLSASLFLSSHQIPHLLVEKHAGTSIHPRGRGVNTRTMELFRSLGIDEAVREAGATLAPSMGVYVGRSLAEVIEPLPRKEGNAGGMGKVVERLSEGVSSVKGARCTQVMLEPVLVKIARERGGELRFNTECTDIQQNDDGITATLFNRENNSSSTVQSNYLIAADGAGSRIRKDLGIDTDGKGKLGDLINIFFHADLKDLVRGREFSLCRIERPDMRGLFTSINNNDHWVFHLSYSPEEVAEYTTERCEELLRDAIGMPDLEIDIKAVLPWQPADRVARKYQVGRIFLAGDAAHQTTPYAGQGATTGIADVFDLAWKLAYVLKGQAGSRLLETYEVERLPVGRFVAHESGVIADEYGLPDSRWGKFSFILNGVMRIAMVTGFGYQYMSQSIVQEPAHSRWTWWLNVPWTIPSLILGLNGRPGTRAPHVWVQKHGENISTLDLFGKNFVLLAGSDGKAWCEAGAEVSTRLGLELNCFRIGPTGDLTDSKHQWEYTAGISPQGALLVRPDGFVAWRVQSQPVDLEGELGGVLNQILYL